MNIEILNKLGQIAGVAGIALGVFFLLFRDVIRKRIFPKLSQAQVYRVILLFMLLSWSVAIAGIIAWLWTGKANASPVSSHPAVSLLTVSLWQVDLDTKGTLVASQEFRGEPGAGVSGTMLNSVADWVKKTAGIRGSADLPKVHLQMDIPADLTRGDPVIRREPDGPMQVLLWDTRGGGKLRLPLDWNIARTFDRDYQIEVNIPGFTASAFTISPGKPFKRDEDLSPEPVKIGIEEFTGGREAVADLLSQQFANNRNVRISSPKMLETIRDEVRQHNERIAKNPGIQMSIRKLGLDYILSGSVRSAP